MKIQRSKMKSVAIYEDTQNVRYALTRTWDENKDRAVVIGISPSEADELHYDSFSGNLINLLIDRDYGAFSLLNLSPIIAEPLISQDKSQEESSHTEKQSGTKKEYLEKNNDLIDKFCDYASTVIVAWGEGNRKEKRQKKAVTEILRKYKEKVMIFERVDGSKSSRPYLNGKSDEYELVPYFKEKE